MIDMYAGKRRRIKRRPPRVFYDKKAKQFYIVVNGKNHYIKGKLNAKTIQGKKKEIQRRLVNKKMTLPPTTKLKKKQNAPIRVRGVTRPLGRRYDNRSNTFRPESSFSPNISLAPVFQQKARLEREIGAFEREKAQAKLDQREEELRRQKEKIDKMNLERQKPILRREILEKRKRVDRIDKEIDRLRRRRKAYKKPGGDWTAKNLREEEKLLLEKKELQNEIEEIIKTVQSDIPDGDPDKKEKQEIKKQIRKIDSTNLALSDDSATVDQLRKTRRNLQSQESKKDVPELESKRDVPSESEESDRNKSSLLRQLRRVSPDDYNAVVNDLDNVSASEIRRIIDSIPSLREQWGDSYSEIMQSSETPAEYSESTDSESSQQGGASYPQYMQAGASYPQYMQATMTDDWKYFRPFKFGGGKDNKTNQELALFDYQIENMLMPFPQFGGVYASDEIKDIKPHSLPFGVVINTNIRNDDTMGHWVSMYLDGDSLEYFDPLGDQPNIGMVHDLSWLVNHWKLPNMLKFKYNQIKTQAEEGDDGKPTITCGYHCINFLMNRFKGIPFKTCTLFDLSEEHEHDVGKKFKYI